MNFFEESSQWENMNSTQADEDDYWRFDAGSQTSESFLSNDDRLNKLTKAKRILSSLQHSSGNMSSKDEDLQQVLNIVIDTISELVVVEDTKTGSNSKNMSSTCFPPVPETVVVTCSGSEPNKAVKIPHPKHRRSDTASTVPETIASSTASSPRSCHRKELKPAHFIDRRDNSDDNGDDHAQQHCYPRKREIFHAGQRNKPEDIFDIWLNDALSKGGDHDEEHVEEAWNEFPKTESKSPSRSKLNRTTSLPPPPPPLTTPPSTMKKNKDCWNDSLFPVQSERQSVPCSVDIYIDEDDECCSVLHVDMDDFDDHTIDEVEFSRELVGYHEGCEPKMVDVVPCVFEADAKAAMSLSRRMLMASSAKRRGAPKVAKTTFTPSTAPSSRKSLARFVIARPSTTRASSSRRRFFLSRRKEPRPAVALAASAAVGSPTCSLVEEDSNSAPSCDSQCYFCRNKSDSEKCQGTMCCI